MLKRHEVLYILKALKYGDPVLVRTHHVYTFSRQNRDTPGYTLNISVKYFPKSLDHLIVPPDSEFGGGIPDVRKVEWQIDYN